MPHRGAQAIMDPYRQSEQSCAHCQTKIRRVRAVPKIGSLPELIVYRCNKCGQVESVEHKTESPGPTEGD